MVSAPVPAPLTEKDLGHWKLLRSFRERLDKVCGPPPDTGSWADPKRRLHPADYLSLFLFGLLNPVAQTLRGFAAATQLERVRQDVCSRAVPRATFSDAQHVLDPALLEKVFAELSAELPAAPAHPQLGHWQWLARDGSLFAALLLQLYTGRRPTRRMMELIRFYLMGWASAHELERGLELYRQELARQKNIKSSGGRHFARPPPPAKPCLFPMRRLLRAPGSASSHTHLFQVPPSFCHHAKTVPDIIDW